IKSIGVGMALAVLIDATIIRVLLVPAAMRLMGRWNWWAPGPLGRLADRLGFSHTEDEPEAVDGDPGEIVAFTDDDAVPEPGWLANLLRNFADPRVKCATGLTLP